jgi:hypothetical protein
MLFLDSQRENERVCVSIECFESGTATPRAWLDDRAKAPTLSPGGKRFSLCACRWRRPPSGRVFVFGPKIGLVGMVLTVVVTVGILFDP